MVVTSGYDCSCISPLATTNADIWILDNNKKYLNFRIQIPLLWVSFCRAKIREMLFFHRLMTTTFCGIACMIKRLLLLIIRRGFKFMDERINERHENWAYTNSNDLTDSTNVSQHLLFGARFRVRWRILSSCSRKIHSITIFSRYVPKKFSRYVP